MQRAEKSFLLHGIGFKIRDLSALVEWVSQSYDYPAPTTVIHFIPVNQGH